MRTIVHLSDLHFGRNDRKVIAAIFSAVKNISPDLIIVSGDLTQRAKPEEFKAAKAFLNRFNVRKVVIPGNHDVPFRNLLQRFFKPLAKYEKYISKELLPFYVDGEVAVIGVNTTRRTTISSGKITSPQIGRVVEFFGKAPASAVKILAAHHPFDLPERFPKRKIISGAKKIVQDLVDGGVDMILGGHMHVSHIGSIAERYKINGKAALIVQASTISERSRGEPPTFNVLKVQPKNISVLRYVYSNGRFSQSLEESFKEEESIWKKTF